MAKIARVEVVDDVDGRPIDSEDVNTVEFSVTLPRQRIARYVLDVRPANLAKFERDIPKYPRAQRKSHPTARQLVDVCGRRRPGRRPSASGPATTATTSRPVAVSHMHVVSAFHENTPNRP